MKTKDKLNAAFSAQHTPGPWKFGKDGNDWSVYADAETAFDLATVNNPGHCGEGEANARLIAAAPELLDALADILPWARAYAKTQRTRLHGSREFQRIERAAAAIAKAEGRS